MLWRVLQVVLAVLQDTCKQTGLDKWDRFLWSDGENGVQTNRSALGLGICSYCGIIWDLLLIIEIKGELRE